LKALWVRRNDFEGFVEQRELGCFVNWGIDGKQPVEWENCGEGFTREYYNELIKRTEDYRKNKGI